ncbi:P27 family phage terminase small subunit [Enterococcus nangangensis]|uniref:P27 family phage terminase small subunit n=1 Tax=Enterococcus nangangensis TaxID=2559926 RepID=UPI0010F94E68|nr:P27 family phage terminase small subunit [Enterococcus nangangensis]
MFKNELAQKRYREKLRRSLMDQLEKQQITIEPFLDIIDRYIKLWETAISLEKDISEHGIRLENGKKNESVALLVSVNKQMGLMLDKLAITPEVVSGGNDTIPEL